MPVLDITQINTKTNQPAGRGSASASNDSSQKFEAVSRQEQQHIEKKRIEQDRRAQQRSEQDRADQRLQERRSEQQRVEAKRTEALARQDRVDAKRAAATKTAGDTRENTQRPDKFATTDRRESSKPADNAEKSASRSDSTKDGKPVHDDPAAKTADSDETKDQPVGDSGQKTGEELPFLSIAVPVSPVPANIQNPALKSVGNGGTGAAATISLLQGGDSKLSQFFSKLAGGLSGDGSGVAGGSASDGLSGFMMKGAAADTLKTGDFSAQLARFQGSGDSSTLQNNATSLQRGLEGRETLAPLKSYSTSVDLPVQHAEWGEKIAGKLAWLTSQRMSAAEIHVTPPDMGPMTVRVQVHNDQAQVTVHAANHVVRDQLEMNGHRLRDMLQENGLNLDSFDVSSQAQSDGRSGSTGDDGETGSGGGSGSGFAEGSEQEAGVTTTGSLDLSLRGEVDTYV